MLKPQIKVKNDFDHLRGLRHVNEYDAPARCVGCKLDTAVIDASAPRPRRPRRRVWEIANGGGAEQHHANKEYGRSWWTRSRSARRTRKARVLHLFGRRLRRGPRRGCSCRGAAGFVHVSCRAASEDLSGGGRGEDLGGDASVRGGTVGLVPSVRAQYHGVVAWALGWACWKTYVGRPEADDLRCMAMTSLGTVYMLHTTTRTRCPREADLAMLRRLGASEHNCSRAGQPCESYEA